MKRFIAVLIGAIMLLSITACSPSTPPPGGDTAPPAGDDTAPATTDDTPATTDDAPSGGGLTLQFLCATENYPDSLQEFIVDYETATGNTVDVQLFPAVEYDQVIRARVMAGTAFDFYRTDAIRAAEYIWPSDWPVALNDRPWIDRMTDTCKAIIAWSDGRITGIPIINNGGFGIMYNKTIFEDAGITEIPKTWSQFLDVCEQLLAYGVTPVNIQLASGSEFGTTHLMHQLFVNIYKTRGVDGANALIDDLNHNRIQYVDIPEFVTALNQMVELRDRGFINEDFITNSFEMSQEKFATGQVAMHPCGDFILAPLANWDPIDMGFFPAPFQDTIGTMASYSGVGISIYNNTQQLEAAFEFIDMFATKEAQDKYMVTNPGMAAFYDVVAESSAISRAIEEYGAQGVVFPGIFESLMAWPEMENRQIIQETMLGSITPIQQLERVQSAADIIARGIGLEGW